MVHRPPKPCHNSMDKQTAERKELYRKASPPGDLILTNIEPFNLDDSIPDDAELRIVVAGLRNSRAGGSGGVQAGHIKTWFHGMIEEGGNCKENSGDLCRLFGRLSQTIWDK